jgi:hypothetical protein
MQQQSGRGHLQLRVDVQRLLQSTGIPPICGPRKFRGGLLPGIFGLPVLAMFIATCFAISVRRLTPIKCGLYVGVALIVCLFAADVGFADATFHGCC